MSEGGKPLQRNLDRARDTAADALAAAYAGDDLTLEEYEDRLDRCFRAGSLDELRDLVADLPQRVEIDPAQAAEADRPAPRPPATEVDRDDHGLVLAFWSGVKRSGRWTPPRHLNAIAVMGGAELDLREARFPEGVTTVNAIAVMGGVEIVVPPGLRVKSSGIPLMGGFDSLDQDGDPDRAPGAVLKIRGMACMGGVEVRVAKPGEAVPER